MKHALSVAPGLEERGNRASSLSPGQPPATPGGEVAEMSDSELMPTAMVRVWEGVYWNYLAASSQMDAGDGGKGEVLMRSSAQVAVTWRRMADAVPGREWWLRAALLTAAEAMEHQAREWSAQIERLMPGESGLGGLHDG